MAIGDSATAAGMPLVPESGEDGLVKYGAREINRTRDFVADNSLPVWPVTRGGTGGTSKATARSNLGVTSGTASPSGGVDGDIYFKIV